MRIGDLLTSCEFIPDDAIILSQTHGQGIDPSNPGNLWNLEIKTEVGQGCMSLIVQTNSVIRELASQLNGFQAGMPCRVDPRHTRVFDAMWMMCIRTCLIYYVS